MPVDLRIIRDELEPWSGGRETLYFTNRWIYKFKDEAREYYGFIPNKRHRPDNPIKVYYREDGTLIISNCRNQELQQKIRRYMENWYEWKKKKYIERWTFHYPISVLIREYTSEIKDGFYQIRYGTQVCNLDREQMSSIDSMLHISTYGMDIYDVDTGIRRLDELVTMLAKDCFDKGTWPTLTESEWLHYYWHDDKSLYPGPMFVMDMDLKIDVWQYFQNCGLPDYDAVKAAREKFGEFGNLVDNFDSLSGLF